MSPRPRAAPRYLLRLRAIREMCREKWFSTIAKIELQDLLVPTKRNIKYYVMTESSRFGCCKVGSSDKRSLTTFCDEAVCCNFGLP